MTMTEHHFCLLCGKVQTQPGTCGACTNQTVEENLPPATRLKRKLGLIVTTMLLLIGLTACETHSEQFVSVGGYVGCVAAGVDAENKFTFGVQGVGMAVVRVGNCNGAAVNARMDIYAQLWHHFDEGPANLCHADNTSTLSDDSIAVQVHLLDPLNLCDEVGEVEGGSWEVRARARVWIEGNDYLSPWISSGLESRRLDPDMEKTG